MENKMQAIWLEENRLFLRTVPIPEIPPGEALIRMRLSGICTTDLELVRGYYPYTGVLGHEFVGQVAACPDDPSLLGQRVVGEINARCGVCAACRAGRRNHCENRTVLGIQGRDGSFAEFLRLPLENLHRVPDDVPDEQAVFTEPLAAAMQILQQVAVRPHDRVLVVGAGRLGQLIAQVLAATGCDLRVLARYESQQARLARLGLAWIAEAGLEAGRADLVVEATGSQSGFESARRAVRPGGTIVLKSTYKGRIQVDFSAVVVDEITLVGSRCGPFDAALRMLATGKVNLDGMVMGRYALQEGLAAFEHAGRPGVIKVLLENSPKAGSP